MNAVAHTSLLALQTALQEHVLDEGDPGEHLQRASISQHIVAGPGMSVARRLEIYHHAYRARLVEALRDSFAHTHSYLGDDWFDRAARAYLVRHPSGHANLRWFGAQFGSWLRETYPDDGEIGELAELDWALRRAFDGSDLAPLALSDLAALPAQAWSQGRLNLHPSTTLLQLRHNTLAIWQAIDGDEVPPAAQSSNEAMVVLVWRQELQPHFRSLKPLERAALDLARDGHSFAAICEQLASASAGLDIVEEAGRLLRRWVDEGLLCGISMPEVESSP